MKILLNLTVLIFLLILSSCVSEKEFCEQGDFESL